ncbi:hypothetical protein B296_00053956 [Ensete ventricosum]|uniref:Uncharacterized protein n=1 Tax=Ensete ventricosum TaxID=4639 RepID=A0A426XDK6_ENSVE|nr:hypothetical protein B296_00053956 [Ensete ventricosum]
MSIHAPKPGVLVKWKDRESSDPAETQSQSKAEPRQPEAAAAARPTPVMDNRLLAGLLAREFLTRGTLFGKRWGGGKGSGPAPASRRRRGGPGQAGSDGVRRGVVPAEVGRGPHPGRRQPCPTRPLASDVNEDEVGPDAVRWWGFPGRASASFQEVVSDPKPLRP